MCDYLERMKKTNVPTKEMRLWSGFAHRVVEYTGPFPTPADRAIMLWLHEESATMLLDMCDDVDEKFSELEAENDKLRELVRALLTCATEGECDECRMNGATPWHVGKAQLCDGVWEHLRELGIEVDE